MAETAAKPSGLFWRHRPTLVLLALYIAIVVFNVITAWLTPENESSPAWAIVFGIWIFEPMIFGVWTALASGPVLTRLPIAAACLMILFIAPGLGWGSFTDMQRSEFELTVLAGFAFYTVTLVLFLGLRRWMRIRIESFATGVPEGAPGVRFSIKYLLGLLTLCALVLGMMSQLKFQPDSPHRFLGPEFFMIVLFVGGSTLSAAVLPTLAVPLLILFEFRSKRAIRFAFFFWAIVTTLIIVVWQLNDDGAWPDSFEITLFTQFGAILAGAFVALCLWFMGYRLTRHPAIIDESSNSQRTFPNA